MRAFLIFAVVAGLGGLYLWQKQTDSAAAPGQDNMTRHAASTVSTPATVPLTPAPRGQASEYNYMKRALDRAATVRDEARAQTKSAQDP